MTAKKEELPAKLVGYRIDQTHDRIILFEDTILLFTDVELQRRITANSWLSTLISWIASRAACRYWKLVLDSVSFGFRRQLMGLRGLNQSAIILRSREMPVGKSASRALIGARGTWSR